jgi:endo-1,4-beta-D-glucanase Y
LGSGGRAGGAGSLVPDSAGPLERGPTAPTSTTKFPFPQNRESTRCTYPAAYNNNDVRAAYAKWKSDLVTSRGAGGHLRVQRTASDPKLDLQSTVSEGIAYGMIVAVYMNDQPLFDELWKYEQSWLDQYGLMDWYINAAGTVRLGTGGATDADEDMAWALIQADKQWGGKGSLSQSYLDYAKSQIQNIWNNEVFDSKLARAGDQFGDWGNINISYFAPAYYRVFGQLTGDTRWNDVITTVYDTIDNALNDANGNRTNGLVPAWCTSEGAPNSIGNYQYDSCRTPFRIGLDWCFFGEPRAKAYVAKTSAFFSAIGATKIADGYGLNGMPMPEHADQGSAAFVGPAGVGAMSDATFSPFIKQAYTAVATGNLMAGGAYYEESWTVMALLMMTGNFLDYTTY